MNKKALMKVLTIMILIIIITSGRRIWTKGHIAGDFLMEVFNVTLKFISSADKGIGTVAYMCT